VEDVANKSTASLLHMRQRECPSGRNETICPSAGDCPQIEDGVKMRQQKRAAG